MSVTDPSSQATASQATPLAADESALALSNNPAIVADPPQLVVPVAPRSGQLASWSARAVAYVIDAVMLLTLMAGIRQVVGILLLLGGSLVAPNLNLVNSAQAGMIFYAVLFSIYLLLRGIYFVGCWTSATSQTVGQRLLGIRVVDHDGLLVTQRAAVRRYLGFLLNYIVLFLGWLWPLWDEQRQGLHDKLARTLVVYV